MNKARSHKLHGNIDAARNSYTRIPEISEFYQQAQLHLQELTSNVNISDK